MALRESTVSQPGCSSIKGCCKPVQGLQLLDDICAVFGIRKCKRLWIITTEISLQLFLQVVCATIATLRSDTGNVAYH